MKKALYYVLIGSLAFYFIFLIRQDIINHSSLGWESEELRRSIVRAENLEKGLRARLQAREDDERVEELARTRLGLIRPGETAYKVIYK